MVNAPIAGGELLPLLSAAETRWDLVSLGEVMLRESAARYFQQHVQQHVFREMVDVIRDLQAMGTELWAVSSTSNWVIEEGVRELHIPPERVLAACVSIEDGLATRTLIDIPSDEGKAVALCRVGLTSPDAVFGNSVHDIAMLEMARSPFAVNPTAALAEEAEKRGWSVYYPSADLTPAGSGRSTGT